MRIGRLCLPALLLAAACAAPAQAREIDRQEIGEVFADENAPERRVYCRDTRLFTLSTNEEVRACINWRAQQRSMVRRTYAVLDGPDLDTAARLRIVRDCFDIAVAAGQKDEAGVDQPDFLDVTRAEFNACLAAQSVAEPANYTIRTIQSVRYSSWR